MNLHKSPFPKLLFQFLLSNTLRMTYHLNRGGTKKSSPSIKIDQMDKV